jgi:hypothetical protein
MHEHYINDTHGNIVEAYYYCSDFCHRADTGEAYQGWNGCHENEFEETCKQCEAKIAGVYETEI